MVVSAIFLILSAVVLTNHGKFGNRIVLENLAYDIALTVREAQVYGIAVRECVGNAITTACSSSGQFDSAYGMYFSRTSPSRYVLFVDVNDNGIFDAGETVRESTIAAGYTIADICVIPQGSSSYVCSVNSVYIIFKRPEPDAVIRRSQGAIPDQRALVVVEAPRGERGNIYIESSGQISVQ